MPLFRYFTPFAFLALVPFGIWQGGAWTFAAAIAIPLCLTAFDVLLGKDRRAVRNAASPALELLPRLYIVLQLLLIAWIAVRIAAGISLLDAVGLTLSNGLTTGVFGLVAAHEMIHDRDRPDRVLGLMLLASVLYMHFSISHVRGHHRDAASPADPATAKLGENVYVFIGRSVVGQFRQAWRIDPNLTAFFVAIELTIVLAVGWASLVALAFLVANAVISILLLETFNYVAHYGLRRLPGAGPSLPASCWWSAPSCRSLLPTRARATATRGSH